MIDTTTEAVERLAADNDEFWPDGFDVGDVSELCTRNAATLRALAAERDAALTDARDFHRQSEIAYAERDAALAQLRAETAAHERTLAMHEAEMCGADAALAREARLREALQRIAAMPDDERSTNMDNMGSYESGVRLAAHAARAALASEAPT